MSSTPPQRLDLAFKGERTYLHGTDMYNAILDFLGARHGRDGISGLDVSFHRMARRAVDLHDAPCPEAGQPVAVCAYRAGTDVRRIYLYESGDEVQGRRPYDEASLVAGMDTDRATLSGVWPGPSPYSDVEVWVALTKGLHQRVLPDLRGQWLFARGQFPRVRRESGPGERRLRIVSNFQNRLTRTTLHHDGQDAGVIYFSLV